MTSYLCEGMSIQNQRIVNMDSLLLKERVIFENHICLAVVCDGVGSLQDGAFAASVTIHRLNEWFNSINNADNLGLLLRDKALKINEEIIDVAHARQIRTATTMSALLLYGEQYYLVHTGDSRIYSCENGAVTQLTQDQISSSGKLTACLGHSSNTSLFCDEGFSAGKHFLLCSDGLYKQMDPNYLQQKMRQLTRRNIRKTIEALAQHVVQKGEKDNISIALVIGES